MRGFDKLWNIPGNLPLVLGDTQSYEYAQERTTRGLISPLWLMTLRLPTSRKQRPKQSSGHTEGTASSEALSEGARRTVSKHLRKSLFNHYSNAKFNYQILQEPYTMKNTNFTKLVQKTHKTKQTKATTITVTKSNSKNLWKRYLDMRSCYYLKCLV